MNLKLRLTIRRRMCFFFFFAMLQSPCILCVFINFITSLGHILVLSKMFLLLIMIQNIHCDFSLVEINSKLNLNLQNNCSWMLFLQLVLFHGVWEKQPLIVPVPPLCRCTVFLTWPCVIVDLDWKERSESSVRAASPLSPLSIFGFLNYHPTEQGLHHQQQQQGVAVFKSLVQKRIKFPPLLNRTWSFHTDFF